MREGSRFTGEMVLSVGLLPIAAIAAIYSKNV
jgi:hypothetical protein